MIALSNVGIALTCDICGETIEGFHDFEEAVGHKKEIGWTSELHNGEWEDICPECQEG